MELIVPLDAVHKDDEAFIDFFAQFFDHGTLILTYKNPAGNNFNPDKKKKELLFDLLDQKQYNE